MIEIVCVGGLLITDYKTNVAAVECNSSLLNPDQLGDEMPTFPEGTSSYLSRHLNEEVWNELRDKEDSYGFTFKQAIFSGCKNPDSGVGMYAGSPNSYPTFSPLFKPVIDEYHKRVPGQKQLSDMDHISYRNSFNPFERSAESLIVSSRIRLARNLEGFPLVPGLSREQRLEVE